MRFLKGALLLLVLGLAVTAASAQTGGLKVVVYDENADTLPGAIVTLSSNQGFIKTTSVPTDAEGVAMFPVLRPGGGYKIDVQFSGYTPGVQDDVRVKISETTTVNIQLIPEMTEAIRVEADSEVVDLDRTDTSTSFNSEFIQDLPVAGRFYQNVLALAPGVQDTDGDGNPNVHGARDRDFKAQVSGVSNQDPLTGRFMSLVNPDSIEEIEVVTSGAGAEYGRAQGGFANIIQKQGSNEREGTFNLLLESGKINGNGAGNLPRAQLPDTMTYQPAIQLSGPIVRDKLWYRLSHEYHQIDAPIFGGGSVAVYGIERQIHDDLVTWQISPRNKLGLQFRYDPQTFTNIGFNTATPKESTLMQELGGKTYSVNWTAPFSTKLLVDSIVAYQDLENNLGPSTRGVPNECLSASSVPALRDAYCRNLETGRNSGSFFLNQDSNSQRLTVKSDATWYAGRLFGWDQQFKFGLNVESERYQQRLDRRPDLFFFLINPPADEGGEPGDLESEAFVIGRFGIPQVSEARATGVTYGVYVSDQIKPLPNLTLNVSMRYGRETINSKGYKPFDPEQEGAEFLRRALAGESLITLPPQVFTMYEGVADLRAEFARQLGTSPALIDLAALYTQTENWPKLRRLENINIENNNFEPRLGVSWDPFKDGKTKVAASAGRYYDKLFLAVPLLELVSPTFTNRFFASAPSEGRVQINYSSMGAINPSGASITVVGRDLKTPYQDEFALSVERELPVPETAVAIRYLRREYRDQLQDIEVNHLPADLGRCFVQGPGFIVGDSPGEGDTVVDFFTGETYVDTDPGPGDGRWDDCAGEVFALESEGTGGTGDPQTKITFHQLPDGIPDAYVQNPAWSGVYVLGNYNTADYTSYGVELTRRQYRGWQLNASYIWSKAIGEAEDYTVFQGDDRALLDDERGFLGYDRRHAIKVNATTITPWGFRLGTAVQWLSGEPYSLLRDTVTFDITNQFIDAFAPIETRPRRQYITNQRNDQRNVSVWNIDINVSKDMKLPRGMNLQLGADVFNILNEPAVDIEDQINGFNAWLQDFGRRYQFNAKLAF